MKKIIIIAEAGVNHNGDIRLAKKMIVVAKDAGASMVKFQTAVPELVMTKFAPKAAYQEERKSGNESQLEMVKRIHLPLECYADLKKYADKKGILFLSSPFDLKSIDALERLKLEYFKVPSGEIINLPYLRKVGSLGKRLIVSTGMASMKEIAEALKVLMKAGTRRQDLTLLHCNTEYPTPFKDVNLRAMLTLRKVFKVEVGYSDHTLGIEMSIAAAALGASVIEKHFTLDRGMHGPDHKASLEPKELKEMVRAIRNIETGLGSGIKNPSRSEFKNIPIVRKSIVAARDIVKGERFTESNITVKRPGKGLSPMLWDDVLGRAAKRDLKLDEVIEI